MTKIKKIFYIEDYNYPNEPIGGDNPYHCCSSCGISDPQINSNLLNHSSSCSHREEMLKKLNISEDSLTEETECYLNLDESCYHLDINEGLEVYSYYILPLEDNIFEDVLFSSNGFSKSPRDYRNGRSIISKTGLNYKDLVRKYNLPFKDIFVKCKIEDGVVQGGYFEFFYKDASF